MKKIIWIICALSLIIFNGCSKPVSSPIQDFKEVFLSTSDENVCLWVPDLEKNDWIREKTQKPFDIEQYYKLKNHTPLSYYKEDSEMFREKIETLLNNLELKETEKFHKYRILMRICIQPVFLFLKKHRPSPPPSLTAIQKILFFLSHGRLSVV